MQLSLNTSEQRFKKNKNFTIKIFICFFRDSSLRFGMVPRQCNLDLGFHLNTYDKKQDISDHLNRKKEQLSPADHIRYLLTDSFTPQHGDRDGVSVFFKTKKKIGVLAWKSLCFFMQLFAINAKHWSASFFLFNWENVLVSTCRDQMCASIFIYCYLR